MSGIDLLDVTEVTKGTVRPTHSSVQLSVLLIHNLHPKLKHCSCSIAKVRVCGQMCY